MKLISATQLLTQFDSFQKYSRGVASTMRIDHPIRDVSHDVIDWSYSLARMPYHVDYNTGNANNGGIEPIIVAPGAVGLQRLIHALQFETVLPQVVRRQIMQIPPAELQTQMFSR